MINEKRREIQIEAVDCLQDADFNGFVISPTGLGKAWMLIECLKRINPQGRIWYLCDSTLNRDETFRLELEKWGGSKYIDRIEFMCYQTACKLQNEDVEVVLADEVDFALTKKYSKALTKNKFRHMILVSATLSDEKRELAEQIAPIVYEKHLQEIQDDGVLNKTDYYFVKFRLNAHENAEYLNYNREFQRLLSGKDKINKRDQFALRAIQGKRKRFLSSLDSARNICRRLIKDLYEEDDNKLLIFCGLTEQADSICKFSYHGKSELNFLEMFNEGTINVLSVVSKIDRGINLNNVNNIIFESPTQSTTKFLQRSGRGRRLAVDKTLKVFFLIPYYKTRYGEVQPTIVHKWVTTAAAKLNFQPVIYKFKN